MTEGAASGLAAMDETILTDFDETLIQRDSVDAIILAGTDLVLIFDESNITFPHVDCARVHLAEILRRMLE